jgi:hypothetical protein
MHPNSSLALSGRPILLTVISILAVGVLALSAPASAYRGQWSFNHEMGISAVHSILLPGDGTYHSRILVWDDGGGFEEFGWSVPDSGGCNPWTVASLGTP